MWDAAYDMDQDIPVGEGLTLIGCTAARELEVTKVNLWDRAFVLRRGQASRGDDRVPDGRTDVQFAYSLVFVGPPS